jgi:hypothetical protein
VEEAMALPLAVSTQACGSNRSLKKPAAKKMTNGRSASAEKIWTHARTHASVQRRCKVDCYVGDVCAARTLEKWPMVETPSRLTIMQRRM